MPIVKTDWNSFNFSLINSYNSSFKAKCVDNCTYRWDGYNGPIFGQGHDIFISSNSNQNQKNYPNFGWIYRNSKYPNNNVISDYSYLSPSHHLQNGTKKCHTILAGSYKFQTRVEVYTKDVWKSKSENISPLLAA